MYNTQNFSPSEFIEGKAEQIRFFTYSSFKRGLSLEQNNIIFYTKCNTTATNTLSLGFVVVTSSVHNNNKFAQRGSDILNVLTLSNEN